MPQLPADEVVVQPLFKDSQFSGSIHNCHDLLKEEIGVVTIEFLRSANISGCLSRFCPIRINLVWNVRPDLFTPIRVSVTLESHESIYCNFVNHSRFHVWDGAHIYAMSSQLNAISLNLPSFELMPASFISEVVSIRWKIRFKLAVRYSKLLVSF